MSANAAVELPEICISVAARPGRFGLLVHNAGYRALGLNFVYRPCRIDDIGAAVAAVRVLGIRGCSVSMPFKETVLPHLDEVDASARRVGAVNSVVNRDGVLVGYNTDVDGVRAALAALRVAASDRVVVLGAGGVARATLVALEAEGVGASILCARSAERSGQVAAALGATTAPWTSRDALEGDLLVNATPIGMAPEIGMLPIAEATVPRFRAVLDLVATPPDTALVRAARAAAVSCVDGLTVALHQAARQFTLYTGREAPIEAMRTAARQLVPQEAS